MRKSSKPWPSSAGKCKAPNGHATAPERARDRPRDDRRPGSSRPDRLRAGCRRVAGRGGDPHPGHGNQHAPGALAGRYPGRPQACGGAISRRHCPVLRYRRLFAHRVVRTAESELITRGDALTDRDPPLRASEVLGVVVGIIRGSRPVPARAPSGGGRKPSTGWCSDGTTRG